MRIVAAESTDLFVGTEAEPSQVVRVRMAATGSDDRARVGIVGERVGSSESVAVVAPGSGAELTADVPVNVQHDVSPGATLPAEVVLETESGAQRAPVEITVAETGWRMFMVSHFHYDPVWWNTQAAYTETWGTALDRRQNFQEPGLALVKAHLEMARRDADYKFVLAELDYLKPYWDVYPEDREFLRKLLADGRLELMGGTYNEPNTNLTSAETTIRNAIYGVGYQRDVLGGTPATAWQLDAFGHDPQFPGIMADAGVTSTSWARGPFHEWGPHWVRGPQRAPATETHVGEKPRMQFASEFDWVAPSGAAALTAYMANHYSAGWWMDAAATLEEAEAEAYQIFTELKTVSSTKNVMLPVGTDYTPPNKWVTAIHRDWGARYVWPKFLTAIPREFFEAVRRDRAKTGRGFSPQTRDMNPVYTGKDVSYIDTKQAQRVAENTLLAAEKFATIASLLGARYPAEAIDKAWRQLLFGAHHDGITGSESDQVYLDLLGGWREATELGTAARDGALEFLGAEIQTEGEGQAIAVFNPLSWRRTDLARVALHFEPGEASGLELRDDSGAGVSFVAESSERWDDGSLRHVEAAFLARDVPALGYRTFRAIDGPPPGEEASWSQTSGDQIENERYAVAIDRKRGGALASILDKKTGKQLLRDGGLGNELLAYGEYDSHPQFGEGPWHLVPNGTRESSADYPAEISIERSALGSRIRLTGGFGDCRRTQEIVLWNGLERIEFATRLDDFSGQDRLFRIRFAADVRGGAPISEVGNAVIGRPFGFPNVDVDKAAYTLDNPAYNWFALGATARVALRESGRGGGDGWRASRALSVAEVIVPGNPAHDDAVRALVVALVRQGVTATLTRHDGSRYGTLDLDSNLPDVRIVVGGPAENAFAARLFEEADARYADEFGRQIGANGSCRTWVPAARTLQETWHPTVDVRGVRDLPALVVAGADELATIAALEALAADLDDGLIEVMQPAELEGTTGSVEDYSVALLNRGIPGFNVEPDGSMYLSLMRSCSGWPSGVWIDPPRRTVPDGSNFQFQHWSHTFEYALTGGAGDWRKAGFVRQGHDYNNPLVARVIDAHSGTLPSAGSFVEVEPASAVLTVLKPTGNPAARMARLEQDEGGGVTLRLYEASGAATEATVRCFTPLRDVAVTGLLEEESRSRLSSVADGGVRVALEPYSIVTVTARADTPVSPDGDGRSARRPAELAPRSEIAQPVFADYWMHNKGAAPVGYQPLTVQIQPGRVVGRGPFQVPVAVASERTDEPVSGRVELVAPPGWRVDPSQRPFRLAPGAFLAFDATVTPPEGTKPGRYFVAARIQDVAQQTQEDVVTVDFDPAAAAPDDGATPGRSAVLSEAIDRAMRIAGLPETEPEPPPVPEAGGEVAAELRTRGIRVANGDEAELVVSLSNRSRGEVRGEVQLISPHETWSSIRPWTQGFTVAPESESTVTFRVAPPFGFAGGAYWALAKVMYFGRLLYTESVPIELTGAARVAVAAGASARTPA